ncbi:WD40/YVTN/BNR-like repeat-containing protein [Alishewanella longhuensis]
MHNNFSALCLTTLLLAQSSMVFGRDTDDIPDALPKAAVLAPLAERALFTDLVTKGNRGYAAVGERGHILISTDGQQWQQAQVPVQALLTSVYFTDADYGWAVGHDATILHTQDGGSSWQLQQFLPKMDKPLMDVYFFNRQHGLAIGAYGMFYTTDNGGASWQSSFHLSLVSEDDQEYLAELAETDPEAYLLERESVLPHFNRLMVQDEQILMVGEAGFVAISEDAGQSWQRLEPFYNGSLFDIHRTQQGTLLVAGLRGNMFRSDDNGESWQDISLPVSATLSSIIEDSSGQLYLTGNAGTLLHSADDGLSFRDLSQADGRAILNGLPLANTLLLVTESGIKLTPIGKSE